MSRDETMLEELREEMQSAKEDARTAEETERIIHESLAAREATTADILTTSAVSFNVLVPTGSSTRYVRTQQGYKPNGTKMGKATYMTTEEAGQQVPAEAPQREERGQMKVKFLD